MNEIGLNKLYVVIEDGKINSTHAYFYKEDAEASNKNGKIMTLLEFLEGPSEHEEKLIPGLDRVIRDEVKQILNLYPRLPFEVLVSLYTRDLVKLLVYYPKRLNEQNKKDISNILITRLGDTLGIEAFYSIDEKLFLIKKQFTISSHRDVIDPSLKEKTLNLRNKIFEYVKSQYDFNVKYDYYVLTNYGE